MPLNQIDHVVVLMLENRSFDHMLGYLYTDSNNVSPLGHPFAGLNGSETNPDGKGGSVPVFRIVASTANAYFMPGADPGEGYQATNSQLFGNINAPTSAPAVSNQGFVTDFSYTLGWETRERPKEIIPGTTAANIMGCFAPEMLPVLSGLARGFAVCDHWFASLPTETMPNRSFACAATAQGHMDDHSKSFTVTSIFGALSVANLPWAIYGYTNPPLTRHDFPDTLAAPETHFGLFSDFQAAASSGNLPAYTFLEPSWGGSNQNDQHPVSDVSAGEQLIHDVYYALRNGPAWAKTLLIITYDEHGGCFDHVAPPWTATPPDASSVEFDFDCKRFGVRVPAVLVSPLIEAGTVFRVADGATPLDHTAILKTVETRWQLAPLTQRDAAAVDLGAVLTLTEARTDDPLQNVVVPKAGAANPTAQVPTHLQQVHASRVASLPIADASGGAHHRQPQLNTADEHDAYIQHRTRQWSGSRS